MKASWGEAILIHDSEGSVITGTKEDLDCAFVWARAFLASAYGPEEGERALKTMPALVGFCLWKAALEAAPEA